MQLLAPERRQRQRPAAAVAADFNHPSCVPRVQVLRADGGASANDLLLQLQADLLQVPVHRPAHQETTALGAAYAAGDMVTAPDIGMVT